MSNKRRRCFTIAEKVKIERLKSGVSNKDLCQELGISQSTLFTIWKSKDQIKRVFQKDVTSNKRLKCSQHQDVDQALLEWFKIQRSKNIPISGPILQEKATEIEKRFNKIDFQCSSSWITRFRQIHNIVFGKISGESSSVPAGVSKNWLEHVWPNLRKNYADCDIYNADETGLFYRLTPSETLRFKGETCSGEEQGKDIKISVLDAILMISDAWNDVSTTIIRNCFHHAGFKALLNDETEIVNENNLDTECFSEENIQSFAEVDDALLTNEEPTEEEIVKSILNANNDESNKQADEESEEIVFKDLSLDEVEKPWSGKLNWCRASLDLKSSTYTSRHLHLNVPMSSYLPYGNVINVLESCQTCDCQAATDPLSRFICVRNVGARNVQC
ncbi:hypothetical protein QTP88_013614 [Uroleucon formosanum]